MNKEKVLDFLEKNVQWFALGFGGLFLLWMVWGYVVGTPVPVEVGKKTLTPGEIDAETVKGPVARLKTGLAADAPVIAMPNFTAAWREGMEGVQVADLVGRWPQAPAPEGPVIDPKTGNPTELAVKELPDGKAFSPSYDAVSKGRTFVQFPDPAWVPPRNDPNAVPDLVKVDKDWVTVAFTLDPRKMETEFRRVFGRDVPPLVYETMILNVEMAREEQLPNGQWGNRVTIKPLDIHDPQPFPGVKGTPEQNYQYIEWATQNPGVVTQPAFYEVVAGNLPWVPPGEEVPEPILTGNPGDVEFDPANPPRDLRKLTPEQRRQVMEYKRDQQRQKRQQRQGVGGRPTGPMGPGPWNGGRPPGFAPLDADRPTEGTPGRERPRAMYAQAGPVGPDGRPYGPNFGPGGIPRGMPRGVIPRGIPRGVPPRSTPYRDPTIEMPEMPYGSSSMQGGGAGVGAFNVTTLDQPIRVWAHDDTVQPEKTYRYAAKIYIRNPLFTTTNIGPKELSENLAIPTDLSNWSEPVKVNAKVDFFIAGVGSDNVKLDVFTWEAGRWKQKQHKLTPGDQIPSTDWSVVDLHPGYILIAGTGGQLTRRDFQGDRTNPRYQELRDRSAAAGETAAAAR